VRAFVTGGTGFIGGRMVERLLDDGWDVSALVRSPERAARIRDRGATLVLGDVTEPETFEDAVKGADALFHLAAYYALGVSDRELMMRINVGGTEAILRAAGAPVPRKGRGDSSVPQGLRTRGVTSREMDVLRLVGRGLTNADIAKNLFLSRRTVETHIASLLRKLDAQTRAQLMKEANTES